MRRTVWISLSAVLLCVSPGLAQTLSSRPAFFADPALTIDPAHGELVLGRTTLRGAMRIFAVELQDSVRLPLAHPANPDTLPSAMALGGPAAAPAIHYRLDLGAGRYTLYFDKNQRLVGADAGRQRLPRVIRRQDLVARYASLRPVRRPGSVPYLEAPLSPCISMLALAGDDQDGASTGHLEAGAIVKFGYRYTCPTRPAEQRAILPDEP
jgi:hypothetical protein